jgi:hypothetical protein
VPRAKSVLLPVLASLLEKEDHHPTGGGKIKKKEKGRSTHFLPMLSQE